MRIETEHYTLIQGDALDVLPTITGMDLCLTDAPYLLTSGGQTEGGLHERFGGGGVYDNSGNFFEGECPKWEDFTPLIFKALRDDARTITAWQTARTSLKCSARPWHRASGSITCFIGTKAR